METRFKMLTKSHPKIAEQLMKEAQVDVSTDGKSMKD